MMISPESFIEKIKDKSYKELLIEKKKLFAEIERFENKNISFEEYCRKPSPDVKYQMHLEYLSALCILISEKFGDEKNAFSSEMLDL